jgi:hypothetical protein
MSERSGERRGTPEREISNSLLEAPAGNENRIAPAAIREPGERHGKFGCKGWAEQCFFMPFLIVPGPAGRFLKVKIRRMPECLHSNGMDTVMDRSL